MRKSWFQVLFGFAEGSRENVQSKLVHAKDILMSKENNRSWAVGQFETPSLRELRAQVAALPRTTRRRKLRFSHVFGDVQGFLANKDNACSTFQVASQFNCLEFVSPSVVPEDGITRYAHDMTQGPACSIACGAATAVRNYLIPITFTESDGTVTTQLGQTRQRQIENLCELNKLLGNEDGRYFVVKNGYTLATDSGLEALNKHLEPLSAEQLDELRASIRVGVHQDVQVTSENWGRDLLDAPQVVTQVFSSACSVAYSGNHRVAWEPLASLVLEATYEATLLSAILNAHRHGSKGSKRVYLTAVGGGVFGNSLAWIAKAIERACGRYADYDLDVRLISYARNQLDPHLAKLFLAGGEELPEEEPEEKKNSRILGVGVAAATIATIAGFLTRSAPIAPKPAPIATPEATPEVSPEVPSEVASGTTPETLTEVEQRLEKLDIK